jgi:hypothetical protein
MKFKLGPVLSFRGSHRSEWKVSVLTATELASPAPTLQWQTNTSTGPAAKVNAKLLHAFPQPNPTTQVWRFDFSIELTAGAQSVGYRIPDFEGAWTFAVPARGAMPNMTYSSCNGFSSLKAMNDTKDPFALWRNLADAHRATPYHLMLMGGDQLYADSMFDEIGALHEWMALPHGEKIRRKFTQPMKEAVDRFYRDVYLKRWSQPDMALMLASIPSMMMWDDHDIFDGWGSYDPELQRCEVFQGLFATARKYFALYQLQLGEDEKHPAAIPGQSTFNYAVNAGDLTVLALDMRSERSDAQVISSQSWKAIYDWIDVHASSVQHLFVMSSIPVVYPDFSVLEKALSVFPGRQELEDDLRDHWNSNPHKQERLRLIHRLFAVSKEKQCRVTLLSGDVHVGALGIVRNERNGKDGSAVDVINQLTSSGIVHPAPPGMVLFFLEQMAGKELRDDRDIVSMMTEFPGTRHFYIGARNWLALEPDTGGRIWANWHVENEQYPFVKVIHPIGYKMQPAVVQEPVPQTDQ